MVLTGAKQPTAAVGEMLLEYYRKRSALDDTFSEELDACHRLEAGHDHRGRRLPPWRALKRGLVLQMT